MSPPPPPPPPPPPKGMEGHPLVQYQPEKGLQEVLCNLDGKRRKLEDAATRIRLALDRVCTYSGTSE